MNIYLLACLRKWQTYINTTLNLFVIISRASVFQMVSLEGNHREGMGGKELNSRKRGALWRCCPSREKLCSSKSLGGLVRR